MDNPGERSWIAYDKKEYSLIKKIINQGRPLKNWDIKINYGLKTGYNDAFIIDSATRDRLVLEDPKSAEIIKPILRGEDIKAYVPKWAGLWLINSHNGVKKSGLARVDVSKDYPAVFKWLTSHQTALEKRYDKGDHWTNLRNCAYLEEFGQPKIIYPNMTKYMPFVYDKHQFFTNDKSFILTGSSLKYLTAFLNSSLFKFAFKDYFPELLGDTLELRKVFFENVTVREVDNDLLIAEKLDLIAEYKLSELSTAQLEKDIDAMIFDIYELTTSERSMIAGTTISPVLSESLISAISSSERE